MVFTIQFKTTEDLSRFIQDQPFDDRDVDIKYASLQADTKRGRINVKRAYKMAQRAGYRVTFQTTNTPL